MEIIKYIIFIIVFIAGLNNFACAQNLFFSKDSLYIASGTTLCIAGGLKADSNALLVNNGKVIIKTHSDPGNENWTNNTGTGFLSGTGKVIFSSSEQQAITGTNTTVFYDLEINNTSDSGIDLGISAIVQDTLFMYDGIINTGSNFIIVTNVDSSAITGYTKEVSTPSFINGNLRRYINPCAYAYGFPVGWNGLYYLQEIQITDLQDTIIYLDAKFDTLDNHNNAELNVTESGNEYESVCNEGVWYLTPDQQPSSVTYNYWGYTGNFTGCVLEDNRFAILKRYDNSLTATDWDCDNCGIGNGLNPNNGDGRLVTDGYALRKGMSSFSQFGIGKIACSNTVELGNDTSFCQGSSVILDAGPGFSYNWSGGSTDQTLVVNNSGEYHVTLTDNFECTYQDNIIIIVNPAYVNNINIAICEGDSILLGGEYQTTAGIYYDSLSTVLGCDSVFITILIVHEQPEAINDTIILNESDPVGMVDISINDYGENLYYSLYSDPLSGQADITENGIAEYFPVSYIDGIDHFIYMVCDTFCVNLCDTARVIVIITDEGLLFIPNAITPDGDGINDYFVIKGIESFPENEIVIFNRWGNTVYESSPYQNEWRGTSKITGEVLTNGTYYYILKTNKGTNEVYTGYIEVVR